MGLGKYVPSSLIKDIFQCFITNSEHYTDTVLKNYMVWPWTHDAPRIPTDFIMNNNCKIKPLIKMSNEEETLQLSSNQLTHNCFLFNFLKRGREKEHDVVASPYSGWNKVLFFESFSAAEQPWGKPQKRQALVLKISGFFQTAPTPWCLSMGWISLLHYCHPLCREQERFGTDSYHFLGF